jgi:hypothetical protein
MLNLNIDSLALNFTNAEGHEHRIRPIVARAAAIVSERAEGYFEKNSNMSSSRTLGSANILPVSVNLRAMTDEYIAWDIANAWLQAMMLKLM